MSTKQLTGGTRDVNPQWMKATNALTVADQYLENVIHLPVTRIPQSQRATIIEILKVFWFWQPQSIATATEASDRIICNLTTTTQTGLVNNDHPSIIDRLEVSRLG